MTTETYHYIFGTESRTVTRAPKQRLIQIHLVNANGHQSINYNSHMNARACLSKNAFQLYDYLEFIPSGMIWAMSSSNLYEESALKEDTYSKAFKELIENMSKESGCSKHTCRNNIKQLNMFYRSNCAYRRNLFCVFFNDKSSRTCNVVRILYANRSSAFANRKH